MEKVKLPNEIAADIERFREIGCTTADIIYTFASGEDKANIEFSNYALENFETILSALVNGYEVEETPEDKVREYYNLQSKKVNHHEIDESRAERRGMEFVLNAFKIKIRGVNA